MPAAGLPPRLTISVRPDNHLSHGVDYHHPGLSIRMLGGVDIIPAVGQRRKAQELYRCPAYCM
ncbi:hypothetical protein M747DRAFT_21284 [Aspergillus niger ATCC 13496]|uniref:Uncharacterized protein n=1 Tax=Aspergillus niger ATCC 13496 TaxID=1353008 RepID=A0A370C115_ASPNG|nr:hypothetical protein M747DRAFT_21284 [Aspergillus niger ATCC 13496]